MAKRIEAVNRASEEFAQQVVSKVLGIDVTRAELSAAFDRVVDKKNWKYPIDARIVLCSDKELLTVAAAVEFFTGSKPTFTAERAVKVEGAAMGAGCFYRVQAAGYYATIGA